MVIWGCTWRVRAVSAGLRRGAIGSLTCHRLPMACHRLPKPAKSCQALPLCNRFLSDVWLPPVRRKNEDLRGVHSMSPAGLKLRHVDFLQRPEMRSVLLDPFLENDVEGLLCPVTDCHIGTGAPPSKDRSPVTGNTDDVQRRLLWLRQPVAGQVGPDCRMIGCPSGQPLSDHPT